MSQLTVRRRGGCVGWRMHLLVIIPGGGGAVVVGTGAFCCHRRQTRVVGSEERRHVLCYRRRRHVRLMITSGRSAAAGSTKEAVWVETCRAHVAGLPIRSCRRGWWLVVINSQTRWSFVPPMVMMVMPALACCHIHVLLWTQRSLQTPGSSHFIKFSCAPITLDSPHSTLTTKYFPALLTYQQAMPLTTVACVSPPSVHDHQNCFS